MLLSGVICLSCSRRAGTDGRAGTDALPHAGLSECIPDWPAGPSVQPTATPSLQVEAPKILWVGKTRFGGAFGRTDGDGAVLLGDSVAFPVYSEIAFFDKHGNNLGYRGGNLGEYASAPTADGDGNVYFAAPSGVYSMDSASKPRWYQPYGAAPPETGPTPGPLVLSPDGVLYGVARDYNLRAIRAKDGSEIWSQATENGHLAQVLGGAGGAVFVQTFTSGVQVYDAKTGAHLGALETTDGRPIGGYRGAWCLGWRFGISFADSFVLDPCGKQRWSYWGGPLQNVDSGIIALGELLVTSSFQSDSNGTPKKPSSVTLYDSDGQIKVGPLTRDGQPYLAGADGTLYTVYCQYAPRGTNQLIAYSPDLTELWRLDLGGASGGCPAGNGVLDSDGVLYLVRMGEGGEIDLLAIQTRSPGLADSSWPSLRHDNRGTGWLVPWTPPPDASQGNPGSDADVSDAVDAPAESGPSD